MFLQKLGTEPKTLSLLFLAGAYQYFHQIALKWYQKSYLNVNFITWGSLRQIFFFLEKSVSRPHSMSTDCLTESADLIIF